MHLSHQYMADYEGFVFRIFAASFVIFAYDDQYSLALNATMFTIAADLSKF
jgi:hypothetical protein